MMKTRASIVQFVQRKENKNKIGCLFKLNDLMYGFKNIEKQNQNYIVLGMGCICILLDIASRNDSIVLKFIYSSNVYYSEFPLDYWDEGFLEDLFTWI